MIHSDWLVPKEHRAVADNMVLQLAHRLEQFGYDVRLGVGSSAFKIDLGVVDPKNPERFILGIICDGHRYTDLDTVDDKEITCPRMLNRLGWNVMHVWSLDWLMNPESVVKSVLNKMKQI